MVTVTLRRWGHFQLGMAVRGGVWRSAGLEIIKPVKKSVNGLLYAFKHESVNC